MKKLIGSVLVLILISRPNIIQHDFLAYEVFKANHVILAYVKRLSEKEDASEEDITNMLDNIDENRHTISSLLKSKYNHHGKIDSFLSVLSYENISLNDEQIMAYRRFSGMYEEVNKSVAGDMQRFDEMFSLSMIKLNDTEEDYPEIYRKLENLEDIQTGIIFNLRRLIALCEGMFAKLQIA